jgi:hypothetical protein
MSAAMLNAFCRRYDLIFSETGRVDGVDVYWFIGFDNKKRYFTYEEITAKMASKWGR